MAEKRPDLWKNWPSYKSSADIPMIAGSGLTSLGVAKWSSFCAIVISKGQNISSTLMIYQYFGLNQAVLHAKYFPLVQPQKEKEKKLIKKKERKITAVMFPLSRDK